MSRGCLSLIFSFLSYSLHFLSASSVSCCFFCLSVSSVFSFTYLFTSNFYYFTCLRCPRSRCRRSPQQRVITSWITAWESSTPKHRPPLQATLLPSINPWLTPLTVCVWEWWGCLVAKITETLTLQNEQFKYTRRERSSLLCSKQN